MGNNLELTITFKQESQHKWNEKKALIILFVLLNLMLFFINILDVNYLYLGAGMPKGITHKEFVHNGVGMLIISILLALTTILFFFRGNLNFDQNNKVAKTLIYIWIFQNVMMVVSTALRNHLYIHEALFTYKRIGVYYWLFMATTGLITTYIKISKTLPAWYLFKTNSLIAYVLLVLSASMDWDKFIGEYNFSKVKYVASLDKKYLISLSETNLAKLYSIKNDKDFNTDSLYHFQYYYHYKNSSGLDHKLYDFFEKMENDNWRSFNLRNQRVAEEIKRLNEKGLITDLDLSGLYYCRTLKPVFFINNIEELNCKDCRITRLNELGNFKKIKKLNLSSNYISSLDSLPEIEELTHLYLEGNPIIELNYLDKTPNLEVLDISATNLNQLADLPLLPKLKELYLNENKINNLIPLERYPKLEMLHMMNLQTYPDKIPQLKALKYLNIKGSPALQNILKLNPPVNLEYLTLSSNGLKNIDVLFEIKNKTAVTTKFPKLKELNMDNNSLYYLNNLNLLSSLEILSVANNNIRSVSSMATLKNLKTLHFKDNQLYNLHFLDSVTQLKELDLANNQTLRDFSSLQNLKTLTWLDLSNTDFNDLSDLMSVELEHLDLRKCRIKSFEKIAEFKKLRWLAVSYLKDKDFDYLKKLKLKTLYVTNINNNLISKLKKTLPDTEVILYY